MSAYYNECDPFAAQWLRELIKAGLIADGEVDERSITDVRPSDLAGFTQCHFFAGIGGWSHSLRLAGWADNRCVWTGSCPCQPFSTAGKGDGADDSRHLWPTWFSLIGECRPPVVFGEQVASADGLGWLDLVCADLESAGYAIAAADLCAAGIGAPHIRQRLWFVAESSSERLERERLRLLTGEPRSASAEIGRRCEVGALDNTERQRTERTAGSQGCAERSTPPSGEDERRRQLQTVNASAIGDMGDSDSARHAIRMGGGGDDASTIGTTTGQAAIETGATRGFWSGAEWIACSDGTARPIEPGTFPLAHGVPARVGRLRGYGNAIVPQVAQAFIESYLEATA
jgi:DNA (cytosine-5)-methyltransferase 1